MIAGRVLATLTIIFVAIQAAYLSEGHLEGRSLQFSWLGIALAETLAILVLISKEGSR